MFAAINRWIAYGLLVLALTLAAIGAFFALFGGMNDGFIVGLKLFLVPAFIAGALLGGSWAFRMAAQAHAVRSSQRWWIQILAVVITYVALMIAMYAMSLLDRLFPPNA
jgi:uncharacterized membrane-anchored protein